MPAIKRIRLEEGHNVTARLHAAAVDLLPEEMAENAAVKWVVQHDTLRADREQSVEGTFVEGFDEYGFGTVIGHVVASHLQQKLPFYFGSLFHIGRMQVVSNYCQDDVRNLSARDNFSASARNLDELLRSGRDRLRYRNVAKSVLEHLSGRALEHAAGQQQQAENWWRLWLREVEALRAAVDQLEDAWKRCNGRPGARGGSNFFKAAIRIIGICQSPSILAGAMKQTGVRLKPIVAQSLPNALGTSSLAWLFMAIAAYEDGPGDFHFIFRHLEHSLYEWIRDERERRVQPEVEIALEILRRKYGAGNPFDEYLPLCRAATPQLRLLLQEHWLPNGKPSPWRMTWEARLEPEYKGSSYEPLQRVPSDSGTVDWAIRAADSAIKRSVTDALLPAESWDGFLQRLYESKVVRELAYGAGGANASSVEPFTIWPIEAFVAYVWELTDKLNSHGYALKRPSGVFLKDLISSYNKG